mmetsp:Transcript_17387/g.32746  ORF Transcript_17387/g.32746 Transcript_17387/m.32746 type:complete len:248 (-) Transcript_17387:899-1642(-)
MTPRMTIATARIAAAQLRQRPGPLRLGLCLCQKLLPPRWTWLPVPQHPQQRKRPQQLGQLRLQQQLLQSQMQQPRQLQQPRMLLRRHLQLQLVLCRRCLGRRSRSQPSVMQNEADRVQKRRLPLLLAPWIYKQKLCWKPQWASGRSIRKANRLTLLPFWLRLSVESVQSELALQKMRLKLMHLVAGCLSSSAVAEREGRATNNQQSRKKSWVRQGFRSTRPTRQTPASRSLQQNPPQKNKNLTEIDI